MGILLDNNYVDGTSGFNSQFLPPKPRATSANIMNITLVKRLNNITYVVLTGERELPLRQTMMD